LENARSRALGDLIVRLLADDTLNVHSAVNIIILLITSNRLTLLRNNQTVFTFLQKRHENTSGASFSKLTTLTISSYIARKKELNEDEIRWKMRVTRMARHIFNELNRTNEITRRSFLLSMIDAFRHFDT